MYIEVIRLLDSFIYSSIYCVTHHPVTSFTKYKKPNRTEMKLYGFHPVLSCGIRMQCRWDHHHKTRAIFLLPKTKILPIAESDWCWWANLLAKMKQMYMRAFLHAVQFSNAPELRHFLPLPFHHLDWCCVLYIYTCSMAVW